MKKVGIVLTWLFIAVSVGGFTPAHADESTSIKLMKATLKGVHRLSANESLYTGCVDANMNRIQCAIGVRTNVMFTESYALTFWNAGRMWDDERGIAVLTQYRTALTPGGLVFKIEGDSVSARMEAGALPTFPSVDTELVFTGGPDGIFFQPFDKGYTEQLRGSDYDIKRVGIIGNTSGLTIESPNGMRVQIPLGQMDPSDAFASFPRVDEGARFSLISGQVEVKAWDTGEWIDAKPETELYTGDHVRTALESTCIISFKDMSTYAMKPESEIVIPWTKTQDDSKLTLVMGKIWANIKRMRKDGKLEIETTQAVLGIKGTTLVVEADNSQTTLKVLEGGVELASRGDGKKTMVDTGKTASADLKAVSAVSSFDVAKEQADWDTVTHGKLSTNASNAASNPPWMWIGGGVLVVIAGAGILMTRVRKTKRPVAV